MLIAYDISDARRLQKVAKIMKDYGIRVQKSIFEADVNEHRFKEMRKRIQSVITPEEDGIKYFPLCGRCSDTIITYGKDIPTEHQGSYLVI
jgi:CRISPR-associated protein Cas2